MTPAETEREERAVSRELALSSALRELLDALESNDEPRIVYWRGIARATWLGVRDARMAEGWGG